MSRTVRGGKAPGFEYWSKREGNKSNYASVGATQKKITHRKERRQASADIIKFIKGSE